MSAAPSRRLEHRESPRRPRQTTPRPQPDVSARERRRRERHFRRRRRDLLEDSGIALALVVGLVSVTAGLGVLALIEVPLAVGLIVSMLAERAVRRRRAPDRRSVAEKKPRAPTPVSRRRVERP